MPAQSRLRCVKSFECGYVIDKITRFSLAQHKTIGYFSKLALLKLLMRNTSNVFVQRMLRICAYCIVKLVEYKIRGYCSFAQCLHTSRHWVRNSSRGSQSKAFFLTQQDPTFLLRILKHCFAAFRRTGISSGNLLGVYWKKRFLCNDAHQFFSMLLKTSWAAWESIDVVTVSATAIFFMMSCSHWSNMPWKRVTRDWLLAIQIKDKVCRKITWNLSPWNASYFSMLHIKKQKCRASTR